MKKSKKTQKSRFLPLFNVKNNLYFSICFRKFSKKHKLFLEILGTDFKNRGKIKVWGEGLFF